VLSRLVAGMQCLDVQRQVQTNARLLDKADDLAINS